MMNTEAFPQLPDACRSDIVSFLPLDDVLQFAGTCQSALQATLPELCRRREMMLEPSAVTPVMPCGVNDAKDPVLQGAGVWKEMTTRFPHIQWHRIAPIRDRVVELCKHIPMGHPLAKMLLDLKENLTEHVRILDDTADFTSRLEQYRHVVMAQKLLRAIVAHVVHANSAQMGGSVDLNVYLGDVLCFIYLVQNPTVKVSFLIPRSRHQTRLLQTSTAYKSCYLCWLYWHANILRKTHFSPSQRQRLGIPKMMDDLPEPTVPPAMDPVVLKSEMTLVIREFGPLGPAFRGRDTVILRELPAERLVAMATDGDASLDAGEWMCMVHEQSRAKRPMSMKPPSVRLDFPRHQV